MRSDPGRRLAFSALIALAAALFAVAVFRVSPLAAVSCGIAALLWIVARHDNRSGTFLVLAVLLVIVLLVAGLLVAALAYIHMMMSGAGGG